MIDNIACSICYARPRSDLDLLEKDDLLDVSVNKSCNFYKKGQVLFYEGKRPNGVYCLHYGKVKIFKNGIHGKEHIVRFVTPGQFIGIRAFLGNSEYRASAATLEDSLICQITRSHFERIMQKYPDFAAQMIRMLSHMLEEAEDKITSLAQKPVKERLAEALLILNKIYISDSAHQNSYTISLTREDLANIVGTATETVIRLLSELKEQKLVSISGRNITLLDLRGLKSVGKVWD